MEFAVKTARDPKGLNAQDYEQVRDQGVTDEEIVEIVFVAAMGNLGDTIADALKVEVDSMVTEGLGRS
jgi:alkylhydroperoxidase family enzyme